MLSEFIQEIENTAREIMNDLHTALPGEIVSYNAEKGTATVKPVGKFVTFDGDKVDYPKISGVPIVFPFSQTAETGIAFPVKKGDSCLIIISELELDEWESGAESELPLRFSLTNAVAIPGLIKKQPELAKEAIEKNAVVISSGHNKLTVSKTNITVRGDLIVEGNITSTGDISAGKNVNSGSLNLTEHTHTAPYGETGTPH